ncbi:Putative acetyltransferase/acyltransferase [Granulibacter bethesdensis]|uniref:Acetyltransferase/acyltransferase n=1 Tax=Granulibacter bethesdensis TaxID=364410 RepID=A0AAC9P870_9PROT|nr:gamma carbonic anhydrase family protein [Granulibacter bethesdensis]APH54261.1 Putative acetyltransferase/acyltransferase [Granulibacter bethesdensis]APH61846.1 Putative acetyltransferase/acyltransferase [Granulibacter bethesdensis]
MIIAFEGKTPIIHPSAWIAPGAVIIGDVEIGPDSSVWYGCVLRGDTNRIRIGARTNIQDGTIVHVNHVCYPTLIGDDVTIGHAAIVHACELHDGSFVGMGATVMDGAVLGRGSVLGARAMLTPGKVTGEEELWIGSPAKLQRCLSEQDKAMFADTVPHYLDLSRRHARTAKRLDEE